MRARKLVRGLRRGLVHEEGYFVAGDAVRRPQQCGNACDFQNAAKPRPRQRPEMIDDAFKLARRRIVNNALRRGQKSLDLSHKDLTELPPEIGQLAELKVLYLHHNRLSTLPVELFRLSNLELLDISDNQFNELPSELKKLEGLRYLDASNNALTRLPNAIVDLVNLRALNLRGNALDRLPTDFGRLIQLYDLDLARNAFASVPAAIWKLVNLMILNLRENRIGDLPQDIGGLRSLRRLDISHNEIRSIPSETARLRQLVYLDLSDNRLEYLPQVMGQMRSLEVDVNPAEHRMGLWLELNPLPEPYPALIAGGQPSATENVLRWLRGELDPSTLPRDLDKRGQADLPTPSSPEIPAQGYGPHFEVGDNGAVTFAKPGALDRQGNNISRLKRLHPALLALSSKLIDALGKGNVPHWYLRDRAQAYHAVVNQNLEDIDFSLLYVEGVRLANAERADATSKELPTLEPPIREAVDTLLQVHGPFILSTIEGLEAIAAEERYRRTPPEETEYRVAALDFAQSLQNHPEVIDTIAAAFVLGAAQEIGRGASPERSGTIATGTIKNVAITISTAASLAALSAAAVASGSPALLVGAGATVLVVGEGLKKSKPFAIVSALVTKGLDKISETELIGTLRNMRDGFRPHLKFVLVAESQLRRLAGQREEFKWLTRSLDWIKQEVPKVDSRGW